MASNGKRGQGSSWTVMSAEGKAMDCIYLAQDRDQWRALVNTVMKLWVS
jgi:hypothetical protein